MTTASLESKGYLEIWKLFPDGGEELYYAKNNVITVGLPRTLGLLFNGGSNSNIGNFQIRYFQLGLSGSEGLQVSSTAALEPALTSNEYGDASFLLNDETANQDGPMGVIPFSHIKRLNGSRVMYQIMLDENTANGLTLNEIGLFSKNPEVGSPELPYLCAYRYFDDIEKTQNFSLLFKWTIEF